jgi:hypothetical protein
VPERMLPMKAVQTVAVSKTKIYFASMNLAG